MATETSAYSELEADFQRCVQPLQSRVAALGSGTSYQGASPEEISQIEKELLKAKQLLDDMRAEARSVSKPTRRALGNKIRTLDESLQSIQQDFRRVQGASNRKELFDGAAAPTDYSDKSMEARGRMQDATRRMGNSTMMLEQSRGVLAETEQVAMATSEELARNRETLEASREKVGEVNTQALLANRILRGMNSRECRYRAIMVGFIVLAVILIAVVLYFIFRPKKH